MRKILTLTLLVCCASSLRAESVSQTVTNARRNYHRIEKSLKNYTRVETDLMGESTEGGKLTAYFAKSAARKISARYYGEMGQTLNEYYFWNGRLFFVLSTQMNYDKPFGKVVSRKQNRYGFSGGKLARWIDENAKTRASSDKQFTFQEREVLHDARRLLAKANQLLD